MICCVVVVSRSPVLCRLQKVSDQLNLQLPSFYHIQLRLQLPIMHEIDNYNNTKHRLTPITVYIATASTSSVHAVTVLPFLTPRKCNGANGNYLCNYSTQITITITITENGVMITANYNYKLPLPQHWYRVG